MKIFIKLVFLFACLGLAGCLTTRVELGAEPNGQMSKDKYTGLFSGPVETNKHCGNKISSVTIKRAFFGENIAFACAGGTTAMNTGGSKGKKMKKKAKRNKKRRKK